MFMRQLRHAMWQYIPRLYTPRFLYAALDGILYGFALGRKSRRMGDQDNPAGYAHADTVDRGSAQLETVMTGGIGR